MSDKNRSTAAAGNINKLTIRSNTGGGAIDISSLVPEFNYYESVLSNLSLIHISEPTRPY